MCKKINLLVIIFCLRVYCGLQGVDKEWPSLTALVTHHTVMPEMLPCTLRLPRNASNPAFKDCDNEREDDDDYQRLADFTAMMHELKM